jgi:hypothetical protein
MAAGRVGELVAFLEAAGLAPSAVTKVMHAYPQVLALSVEQRLKPTVGYLTSELQLAPAEVGKLIVRAPALLGLHPKRTLRPKLHFLVDSVGLEPTVLRQVLLRAPSLLYLSVEGDDAKLKRNLAFLLTDVGIPHERLPRVIEKAPSLLSMSPANNMQPILAFLSDPAGLGIDRARLGSMIAAQPQILMSSLDDKIKPCADFLCLRLRLSPQQAAKVVQVTDRVVSPLNPITSILNVFHLYRVTPPSLGFRCRIISRSRSPSTARRLESTPLRSGFFVSCVCVCVCARVCLRKRERSCCV